MSHNFVSDFLKSVFILLSSSIFDCQIVEEVLETGGGLFINPWLVNIESLQTKKVHFKMMTMGWLLF